MLKSMSVIPYIEDLHSGVPSDEEEYEQDHIFANNGTHIQQENTQCKLIPVSLGLQNAHRKQGSLLVEKQTMNQEFQPAPGCVLEQDP